MAVKRSLNLLGQQRVDVPHFRSLESAICNDFDVLAGSIIAGDAPYVIKGFSIVNPSVLGNPAEEALLEVAGGLIMHPTASEAGTIFSVSATQADEVLDSVTNVRVTGSFQASTANYVGLDLLRSADDTTTDIVQFLSADTLTEVSKSVPLARTLNYQIYVSTEDFDINSQLIPIAIINTDVNNAVTSVVDARPMMFRLGAGGNVPDALSSYTWADRVENVTGDIFAGGDKDIGSFKAWADAVMSRIWEVGGGEHWYCPATPRDVKMIRGIPVAFTWAPDNLAWTDLSVIFTNSTANVNTITNGNANMVDGDCLYVDLDRSTAAALTPVVTSMATLGSGLSGERFVIAWRIGADVWTNDAMWPVSISPIGTPATSLLMGEARLNRNPVAPYGQYIGAASGVDPVVVSVDDNGLAYNAARVGNTAGFSGVGFGTEPGLRGLGSTVAGSDGVVGTGTKTGSGVKGTGGATNGSGIEGIGIDSGTGVVGSGGTTGGKGGSFTGGTNAAAGGGRGVYAIGGVGTTSNGMGGNFVGATAAVASGLAGATGALCVGGIGDGVGADGIGVQGGSGDNYGVYGGSIDSSGVYGIGKTQGVEGEGRAATGGSGLAGGKGVKGTGGAGDGAGKDGIGVEGGSGDWYGVYGGSSSSAGVYGESASGAGVYGISLVGPAGELDGSASGEALRIDGGEIAYVPPVTRHLLVSAGDFAGGTGAPAFSFGSPDAWLHNVGTGAAYDIVGTVRVPAESVITGVRVLCKSTYGINVNCTVTLERKAVDLAGLYTDTPIFDGTAGHGAFTVNAAAAYAWACAGDTANAAVTVGDGSWVRCVVHCGAAAAPAGNGIYISSVYVTYTQAQNSHTI